MGKLNATLPVAILGAGPVGLAAAAHLVERGMTPLIFEAGVAVAANPPAHPEAPTAGRRA